MTAPTQSIELGLSKERKSFLHMMFTTALEGGIQYWADVDTYKWSKPCEGITGAETRTEDIEDFHAMITSNEGDWGISHLRTGYGLGENEPIRIDLTVMEMGARLFRRYCHGEIDNEGKPVPEDQQKAMRHDHYWRQWLVQEATDGEEGDSDAEVADQIVQWGLFGQAVYG